MVYHHPWSRSSGVAGGWSPRTWTEQWSPGSNLGDQEVVADVLVLVVGHGGWGWANSNWFGFYVGFYRGNNQRWARSCSSLLIQSFKQWDKPPVSSEEFHEQSNAQFVQLREFHGRTTWQAKRKHTADTENSKQKWQLKNVTYPQQVHIQWFRVPFMASQNRAETSPTFNLWWLDIAPDFKYLIGSYAILSGWWF